jgi:hypothetical protein
MLATVFCTFVGGLAAGGAGHGAYGESKGLCGVGGVHSMLAEKHDTRRKSRRGETEPEVPSSYSISAIE